MIKDISKTFNILNKKEKQNLFFLSITKLLSGFMDMIGIISILPFLAFISNENLMNQNKIVIKIKNYFEFENSEMIIFLAAVSLSVLLINYIFKLFDIWYDAYVNQKIFVSLSTKLFDYYISRPYSYHLLNSTNELLEKVHVKINFVVIGIIQPIFQIFGKASTAFFITLILLKLNAEILLTMLAAILLIYILIFRTLIKRMTIFGNYLSKSSQMLFKIVDQAFKSIKDIKINHNEKFYSDKFSRMQKIQNMNNVKRQFYILSPKVFLEIITFTLGYLLIIYLLTVKYNSFSEVILTIGIFVLCFQKIIPSIQGIYSDLSEIKYYRPSIEKIYDDIKSAVKHDKSNKISPEIKNILKFTNKIKFNNVKFKYLKSEKVVLDLKDLSIEANDFIGITGKSGSGKSTLIDLITGLLDPVEGEILIDKKNFNQNIKKSWQSNIAYVPQQSFIADDTITKNIALGINEDKINTNKVKNSAKLAKLDSFIENELPLKYNTIIGENGIRLSGGQRQRLSIARALYSNLDLLILDEATSSLDSITEYQILESILNNKTNKTIIMVTHRLSTLKECNKIIFLDKGKIEAIGNYSELITSNSKFSELARNKS